MTGPIDTAVTICALTIEATPHTCLRPNDTTDPRQKAPHRKALREAAYIAMHQGLIQRPQIAQDSSDGRLRLRYQVIWETPIVGQRKRWDDDSLIGGGLKPVRDGICQALGIDDANVETGTVEQSFTEARQGVIIVIVERLATEAGGVDRDPMRRGETA